MKMKRGPWISALCLLALSGPAFADTAVKPYFAVIVDNSGSMSRSTGSGNNSCGFARRRLNDAKCVLQSIVNGYGDVSFGLARFKETCSGSCSGSCGNTNCGCSCSWLDCDGCRDSGSGCPANGASADQGEMLVPIADDNQTDILKWINFSCGSCNKTGTEPELEADTWTPIAGALRAVRRYYEGGDPDFPTSPIASDPFAGCRPYYVILLTDGEETCASDAETLNAATELRMTNIAGVGTFDIRTFVIVFGPSAPHSESEDIALAGGTDAPGPYRAFYAADETELALAFSQIINDSVLVEVCNNADDDCDGLVDEGFVKYCDVPNGITSPVLCTDPGDPCDGVDDNCFAGTGDEPTNACGTCGPTPTETCNGVDDDCDGFVDEDGMGGSLCGGCTPFPEICDGKDNDCDGRFDEGITRPCGTEVGACTPGTQDCIEQSSEQPSGTWGPCSGIGPSPEVCDGIDNDCDGLVDGFGRECYTFSTGCTPNGTTFDCEGICQSGLQVCTGGAWGSCSGEIGPASEVCNGTDDDCDGMIDELPLPGVGDPCTTGCGAGVTECTGGMIVCTGGGVSMPEECNGFDDDCDGAIDEGLPDMGACDEMGTLCVPGTLQCVGGGWQCVGGIPPEPETCDCQDNDCDGATDEEPPSLCPPGATCVGAPHCLCARPCADDEFQCPLGFVCTEPADPPNGFCVPDPCAGVSCEPTSEGDTQICVDGVCTPLCDTITCPGALVCRGTDGACVTDDCHGFPERCEEGELCIEGECVPNPCTGVDCPDGQFCRQGACVKSCAGVSCPPGQSCKDGACVNDPCAGVSCPTFRVCDPATGECVMDMCLSTMCPAGQVCDPLTGGCVTDPCLDVQCPTGQVCQGGDCFDPRDLVRPDAGSRTFVTAAGGGCGCSAGGRSPSLPAALVLGLFALLAWRMRAR